MSYTIPVNTMMSRILYIDSRDATSYLATKLDDKIEVNLNSYFQYVLKENIEVPLNQRALISLNSATIPYSFYNIRENVNDILKFGVNTTAQSGSIPDYVYNLQIPAGNYTAFSLADYLTTAIPLIASSNFVFTVDIEFDTDKQKFIFTFTSDADLTYNFDFDDPNQSEKFCNIELGFRNEKITFIRNSATENQISSQNVVDINGSIHGVYIRTNLVSNGTLDSQSGTFSNILARLPINTQSGGIIFATPNNATHKALVDLRSINILTIRLTDERNRILDLNGLHFQLAISIDFVNAEKPNLIPRGGASESAEGNSYAVSSDEINRQKLQRFIALSKGEEPPEIRTNRRGPGRPRRVGRPKGSKTKIDEDDIYQ
jgi:hypothetical protein